MRFFYIQDVPDVKFCIAKLYYDKKYIILKAKDLKQTCSAIQKGINQFMRGSNIQHKKDNLYIYFYDYIQKHQDKNFSIELLLKTENIYQLLVREQLELDKSRKDKNCLNNAVEPYIPQFNEDTDSFGWIPKNSYLNFKKWVKRHKNAV